jgi:hypothetical protein
MAHYRLGNMQLARKCLDEAVVASESPSNSRLELTVLRREAEQLLARKSGQ